MIRTLVVFGAGGDLTGRLLLPAVAALRASGELDAGFRFVGAGAQDWSDDEFAAHVHARLSAHAPTVEAASLRDVLRYRRADVTDPAAVAGVLELAGPGPVAVYLALPTQLMLAAVRAVLAHGLPAGSRLAVEKPFGHDAASAVELNAALAGAEVYRVDHLLAMSTVQALPEFELPADVTRVELLFDETLALEGRASFYDRAGALRDVMQNHLAQLLCVFAQTPPVVVGDAGRRADVLRAVRPPDVLASRRARYTAGRLADGRPVPDYTAEDGVDASRATETFAEVTLHLDTPRWTGVPFVLRAGKALDDRRRGVVVHRADGDPIRLDLDAPDAAGAAEPVAYQRIVADLLGGGTSYAVSADEAELAWTVFTPVLDAWAVGDVPLTTYPAGSAGPRP